MRKILIGEAANEIRGRLWKLIEVNRHLVVEVGLNMDDKLVLVVYSRLPGAPTIEIEEGVAILRDNIPIRAAISALNAAAGRQVVKARRFGALCPQVRHGPRGMGEHPGGGPLRLLRLGGRDQARRARGGGGSFLDPHHGARGGASAHQGARGGGPQSGDGVRSRREPARPPRGASAKASAVA
jgi:hypothetical protein